MHGGNARRRVAAADLVRCCTALLLALLVAAGATGCRQRSGTTVNIGGTATPNTPGEALWLGFKART